MAEKSKARGAIKFLFWLIVAVGLFYYAFHSYYSGQMVSWYYYKAATDGYAVHTASFKDASKEKPAMLEIGSFETVHGLQAVPVKKGDRLPVNTDGIITSEVLKKGKRAKVEDRYLKVMVPQEMKEAKGFKYKDTFKHKGIKTNPWSGAWNVGMVLVIGLSLGLLAEGFTDMLGFKVEKIEHFEGIH
ncbi:MAG: hypothetical protein HY739_12055 [Desulfobacterales bacterium]|nr:hypothetical protein [Desulfobacterales bacterium]